jgi:hypothetical protein
MDDGTYGYCTACLTVWQRLAPGVYADVDVEELHINLGEMLTAHGYADTAENRATLEQAGRELAGELGFGFDLAEP